MLILRTSWNLFINISNIFDSIYKQENSENWQRVNIWGKIKLVEISFKRPLSFLSIFHVTGILAFWPRGLGSYSMTATASYSYEGLVAVSSAKEGHFSKRSYRRSVNWVWVIYLVLYMFNWINIREKTNSTLTVPNENVHLSTSAGTWSP